MTFFFLFHIQSSSFQGFEDQPLSKADFLSCQCVSWFFLFSCCICIFYFFSSLHAFSPSLAHSQTRTLPSTPHSSVHSLAHATRAAGLLAPPTRGRGRLPTGASCWRRWTWLLSTESRHSYTMGPFTHMSDSVADWGRGTLRVAPSLVGGPQNCDMVHLSS